MNYKSWSWAITMNYKSWSGAITMNYKSWSWAITMNYKSWSCAITMNYKSWSRGDEGVMLLNVIFKPKFQFIFVFDAVHVT